MNDGVVRNPWHVLRRHTPARIGLGRSGVSQPTSAQLEFQVAHAQARDAVHRPFDHAAVEAAVRAQGLPTLLLHSAAVDRSNYLKRPDLGRRLDEASLAKMDALEQGHGADLAVVVADGLSALAVERHAASFIALLRSTLGPGWRWAPVSIVRQGRVAVGDPIGHALRAKIVAVLIGERPGLSSPDSMGIYLTWEPKPGRTDAERNCISNVRPEGLALRAAAERLTWLLNEARARRITGVELKDESVDSVAPIDLKQSFLLGGGPSASP